MKIKAVICLLSIALSSVFGSFVPKYETSLEIKCCQKDNTEKKDDNCCCKTKNCCTQNVQVSVVNAIFVETKLDFSSTSLTLKSRNLFFTLTHKPISYVSSTFQPPEMMA
jgi:hypothetical protein